jgi:hypothetical protein
MPSDFHILYSSNPWPSKMDIGESGGNYWGCRKNKRVVFLRIPLPIVRFPIFSFY